MPSNLRAAPVSGIVSDSAGNILKNSTITIKAPIGSSSTIIDTAISNDDGLFITKPIQNGSYDIYESGIQIQKIIHSPIAHTIQCYPASLENIPDNLAPFYIMDEQSDTDINKFKQYIQIENDALDVKQYGHLFPIYEPNIMTSVNMAALKAFHNLNSFIDSRITTTRFDVEYFDPITSINQTYRRMRFAGIPAIQFYSDSKLVLPIDFYSLVLNKPNYSKTLSENLIVTNDGMEYITLYEESLTPSVNFEYVLDNAVKGDVFHLTIATLDVPSINVEFYCIYVREDVYGAEDYRSIIFKRLKNSKYDSTAFVSGEFLTNVDGGTVTSAVKYDGLYNGLTNITTSTNEKYSVVENIYAQDQDDEIYNYTDV